MELTWTWGVDAGKSRVGVEGEAEDPRNIDSLAGPCIRSLIGI
jgi:hypothetical protein